MFLTKILTTWYDHRNIKRLDKCYRVNRYFISYRIPKISLLQLNYLEFFKTNLLLHHFFKNTKQLVRFIYKKPSNEQTSFSKTMRPMDRHLLTEGPLTYFPEPDLLLSYWNFFRTIHLDTRKKILMVNKIWKSVSNQELKV